MVTRPATLEELSSPSVRAWRARTRRRMSRTVSPWTYRPALSWRTRNGVGLSPVSEVGHCDQATPPPTPRARQKNRNALCRKRSEDRPMLRHGLELGTPTRPKRDASRSVRVRPLRHRPLPDDAGCCLPWEVDTNFWTRAASPR